MSQEMRPVLVTGNGTNKSKPEYSAGMQENGGRLRGEWARQQGCRVHSIKHQDRPQGVRKYDFQFCPETGCVTNQFTHQALVSSATKWSWSHPPACTAYKMLYRSQVRMALQGTSRSFQMMGCEPRESGGFAATPHLSRQSKLKPV